MRNLDSFPAVYYLHHYSKQFENYDQNTERRGEHLFRDTKFTITYREVLIYVQRSLGTLFLHGRKLYVLKSSLRVLAVQNDPCLE